MTQLGLLSWTPPRPAPAASEQDRHLARVEGRLAETILDWLRERLQVEPVFHAADLCGAVASRCGGAPESAMRILRQLRRSGQAQVELESRAASRYRILGVR